jgi:hypothetical protein
MVDTDPIERRCVRFASALHAGRGDRIALLRTARKLKKIGALLNNEIGAEGEWNGATDARLQAGESALEMQTLVRRVLLEHDLMTDVQVRHHLAGAVDRSLEVIDLLRLRR